MIRKIIRNVKNVKDELQNAWDYDFVIRPTFEFAIDDEIFRFYTYGDTLNIPVFHVIPHQTYKDICVCLFEPKFYQYNRDTYIYDHFNLDIFDKLLRDRNIDFPEKSNWEVLIKYWLWDHDITTKELSNIYNISSQPDYTKLEDNPILKRSFSRMIISKWYA